MVDEPKVKLADLFRPAEPNAQPAKLSAQDHARVVAISKKLITAEHAWVVIGLDPAVWEEHERLGEYMPAAWETCEPLRERYSVVASPELLTQRAARALLQALEQRRLAGLASPRQVYYLQMYGAGDETTSAKEAGVILTKLWGERKAPVWAGRARPQEKIETPDDWLQRLIDGRADESPSESPGEGPSRFFDLEDE